MSALATHSFSPVIRSTHEDFVARRVESLQRLVYNRPLRQLTLVAANVPARAEVFG